MNTFLDDAPLASNWRFLPGMPASGSALVVGAAPEDLEAAYYPLECLPEIPDRALFRSATFDLVAFPNGQLDLAMLPKLRSWIKASGVVYVGFGGRFGPLARPRYSLPALMRRLRLAGFPYVSVYGALPDPLAATYLFPLEGEAMTFAISRFLQGRRSGWRTRWLQELAHPWLLQRLTWALPGYAVIAGGMCSLAGQQPTGASGQSVATGRLPTSSFVHRESEIATRPS